MKNAIPILVLILLIVGVVAGTMLYKQQPNIGSVTQGNDYYATSTFNTGLAHGIQGTQMIKKGYGSLGQITITQAGTMAYSLYDATSTASLTGDDSRFTTSTSLLVTIPGSLVAGTYTFDVDFTYGLLLWEDTAGYSTSTISYR